MAAGSERRAGRQGRRKGGRGRGTGPGEEERGEEAAPAARRGGGGGGAESLDWEPRARLGSGRGGAAGTAALPAWAEPRETGLAGPRQPQVGRGWDERGKVSRLEAEAEPRCYFLPLLHRQRLSMELSPRSPPEMLESDCPSPLELKSAPSKKMWIKLRSL